MATLPTPSVAGSVTGGVRATLRLEGAFVLCLSTLLYARVGGGWWWFAGAFFVPDLSFLAVAGGPRWGARAYNAAHSYALPLLLAIVVLQQGAEPVGAAAVLVWLAHIGFDRLLGYGLKYETAFADTHLGRIGRGKDAAAAGTGHASR
jgi:hypothetical protein